MKIEDRIRRELNAAAGAMPERTHDFPQTLTQAKRSQLARRALVVGVAASLLGLGFWGASSLRIERVGITVPPATGESRAFTDDQVETATHSFVGAIAREDRSASWEMLTLRSKQRLGAQTNWAEESSELRAELSWIAGKADRLWITHLPEREPETYLATYTAPPSDGSAYLEVLTLEEAGGELRIDLKRRNEISLQPESPRFMACPVAAQRGSSEGSPCPPEDLWPQVRAGQTFSVLLERLEDTFTTTVDHVWFAVGDNEWVGEARLVEGAKSVRALATFEPQDLASGENVFTVTIETSDGALETYGYRVIYEPD